MNKGIWVKMDIPNKKGMNLTVNSNKIIVYHGETVYVDRDTYMNLKLYMNLTDPPADPQNCKNLIEVADKVVNKSNVIVIKHPEQEPELTEEEEIIIEEEKKLSDYSYKELQDIAKELGVKSTGKKAEIIKAIEEIK